MFILADFIRDQGKTIDPYRIYLDPLVLNRTKTEHLDQPE